MKSNLSKAVKCFMFFIVILLALQEDGFSTTQKMDDSYIKGVKARVIDIVSEEKDYQLVELAIMEGDYANKKLKAEFYSTYEFYGITLKKNDYVLLTLTFDQNQNFQKATITNIVRDKYIFYLFLGYSLLLFVIGGFKGIRAILSLVFSYLIIIKVLFPLIVKGYEPVYTTIFIGSGITVVSLLLIGGFNRKTLSAILGTLFGLVVAAVIAVEVGEASHITGVVDDEFYLLSYLPLESSFSYQGLLFSGIIIGSLGAVMDVSMSIASAINELMENSYNMNPLKLISAGMNVGRDAIGTMTNTLVLAYMGGSIYMMLVLVAENTSLVKLFNSEAIATEILRSMAGSIGLILTVPFTAIISGVLIRRK